MLEHTHIVMREVIDIAVADGRKRMYYGGMRGVLHDDQATGRGAGSLLVAVKPLYDCMQNAWTREPRHKIR